MENNPVELRPFSYLLIRKASETYELYSKEHSETYKLEKILNNLKKSRTELALVRLNLSDRLLVFMKSVENDPNFSKLLNVRREIFNGFKPKAKIINEANKLLPPDLKTEFDAYLRKLIDLDALLYTIKEWYDDNVELEFNILQKCAHSENLQKGLLLSSQTFYYELKKFIEKENHIKKERNIEISLVKYITRICMKTSPFSTFTTVSSVAIEKDINSLLQVKSYQDSNTSVQRLKSDIRLNNALFRHILSLLSLNTKIISKITVNLNPTIRVHQNNYRFLVNHNNIESFQYLERNDLLNLIVRKIRSRAPTLEILIKLLNGYIDAGDSEIFMYLTNLQKLGLFDYQFHISGVDPNWDKEFVRIYSNFKTQSQVFPELLNSLKSVRDIMDSFAAMEVESRIKALTEIQDIIFIITSKLQVDAGFSPQVAPTTSYIAPSKKIKSKNSEMKNSKVANWRGFKQNKDENAVFSRTENIYFYFKPSQLIYEDCTTTEEILIDSSEYKRLTEKLDFLYSKFNFLNHNKITQEGYRTFFRKNYKKKQKVSFLKFYEDYYLAQKINKDISKQDSGKKIDAVNNLSKRWWNQAVISMKNHISMDDNTCRISPEFFNDINSNSLLGKYSKENKYSCSAFVQLYEKGGNLPFFNAVVNRFLPGYGKMFSRFLHILPIQVTEEIVASNNSFTQDNEIFVEITDSSFFNANIHPPLHTYELNIPGSQSRVAAEMRIPITDIVISLNTEKDALIVTHKPTGKNVVFFDSDFQGSIGRSKLFQMVSNFSENFPNATNLICNLCNTFYSVILENISKDNKKIVLSPRVIFDNDIILQRKKWQIPKEALFLDNSLDAKEYFIKINEWRIEMGIPNEVFITINSLSPGKVNERWNSKYGRDDYKPQYVNFTNALMVNLVIKLFRKCDSHLVIEEMLPSGNEMLKFNGKKYATEFLFQWDRR